MRVCPYPVAFLSSYDYIGWVFASANPASTMTSSMETPRMQLKTWMSAVAVAAAVAFTGPALAQQQT